MAQWYRHRTGYPEVGGSSSRGGIYGKRKYWKFLVGEELKGLLQSIFFRKDKYKWLGGNVLGLAPGSREFESYGSKMWKSEAV